MHLFLQHIYYSTVHYSTLSFTLVCLAKVCEHSVLPNVIKDPLLIVSYFAEVVSKNPIC